MSEPIEIFATEFSQEDIALWREKNQLKEWDIYKRLLTCKLEFLRRKLDICNPDELERLQGQIYQLREVINLDKIVGDLI